MKVLMITGDMSFGPGNPRFELQKSVVAELAVVYWGRGSLSPKIPVGPFDVITAQDPFWRGVFAWHVAKRFNARLNVQVHADLSGQSFAKRLVARFMLRHADSVRAVSEKINQQVLEIAPRATISVLPIFVDISKFQSVVRQSQTSKNILWIGRFEEEKNPLAAIDVLKEVLKTVSNAKLTMLGKGSLEARLKRVAQGLPVEFPGWQDPIHYLETANVVVCTSWHESFGASIIESLAAGVPVVAPDVGMAKEAGAIIAPRTELGAAVVTVLKEGSRGHLALHIPTAEEWKQRWQKSL